MNRINKYIKRRPEWQLSLNREFHISSVRDPKTNLPPTQWMNVDEVWCFKNPEEGKVDKYWIGGREFRREHGKYACLIHESDAEPMPYGPPEAVWIPLYESVDYPVDHIDIPELHEYPDGEISGANLIEVEIEYDAKTRTLRQVK